MNLDKKNPIGVFDSGVGGLTVARALMERLPMENILYFGDTARVPYGVKSQKTIETFAMQIVEFLLKQDVKALVVACNTIAAVALETIKKRAGDIPVFDVISAGAMAAVQSSTAQNIGVIATNTTVNSNAYAREIAKHNSQARVISRPASVLVSLAEEGWVDNEIARLSLKEYVSPLLAENIDTLILGCTHFPLFKPLIKQEFPKINLVDSSITTAENVAKVLAERDLLNNSDNPEHRFYVSDIPLRFQMISERFLGRSLGQVEMLSLG